MNPPADFAIFSRDRAARVTVAWLIILVLCCTLAPALADPDYSAARARVDALFSPYTGTDRPGCAIGVIHNGQYIFMGGYGMASLEYGIPLGTQSVFRTGSVSKQFTAMAIAILSERGELSLDADVHTYLPDLMDYSRPVTIRQMLHHTSGMGDYGDSPELYLNASGEEFRWGDEDYLSTGEFLDRVLRTPLAVEPGVEFRYSNFAYFLLGQVVERVSGMSLRSFAQENIFGPLSMKASSFNDSVDRVVKNVATGYRKGPDGQFEIYMTNLDWVGDGGLYTSIEDFIHWDQNFYANVLGKGGQDLIELMQSPGVFPRNRESQDDADYGLGQELDHYRGQTRIAHSGSWVAFTAYYARFPDQRLSTVIFCNNLDASAAQLGQQVSDIYLDLLQVPGNP